jgi:hypothetical protein
MQELCKSQSMTAATLAGGLRVVRYLIANAPQSVIAPDGSGKLPVQLALELSCLESDLHALHKEMVSLLGVPVDCDGQADNWYGPVP